VRSVVSTANSTRCDWRAHCGVGRLLLCGMIHGYSRIQSAAAICPQLRMAGSVKLPITERRALTKT